MNNLAEQIMEQLAAQRASRAELSRALWAMSPGEREAAMRRGELTGAQLLEWAQRRPGEIPTINGEWAFIAINTPEVADLEERQP
jgi:hypothetical protein